MLSFSIILLLCSKYTFTSAFTNGAFDSADITTAVNDHNNMRRQVAQGGYNPAGTPDYTFPKAADMIQLEWGATLATTAKTHAQGCTWGHSSTSYGENIAATTDTSMTTTILQNMIDGWLDNEAAATSFTGGGVNYGNLVCDTTSSRNPPVYSCGHFTQGIWANTAQIGCGYKECSTGSPFPSQYGNDWLYLVCNYSPSGNWATQDVYTIATGTSSCTTASCPTGYKNCINHLCAVSTPSPTGATSSPTLSPTHNPVAGPSGSDIYFCKYIYNGFNGAWTYASVDRYTKNTGYGAPYTNPFVMYSGDFGGGPWFVIDDGAGIGWFALCTQSTISSCTAGQWQYYTGSGWAVDSDAFISSTSCPDPAQSNNKLEASHSFKRIEEQPIDNKSYPLNMTEMHVILAILILVLIIMCGMIFGFFYYVKKNKKKEKHIAITQENEMVYFERENDEHNTPTVELLNDSNQNQPSLKINVNGTATMVTKLPTTTPVTPLINLDQDYE